jgi:hypothetical protein
MACAITSLFLMAMFGIIVAGVAFGPSAQEKSSARRQETPAASPSHHVIPKTAALLSVPARGSARSGT